jgi:flagellar capping protein FliD
LVETSDAPPLTAEVLAEKGKLTKTVELVFEDIQQTGEHPKIERLNGVPFSVEVARAKILREFQGKETKKDDYERNLAVLRLLVSKMVVDPKLSFRGKGEGSPIEEQSDLLLEAFYESIVNATSPMTLIGTHKDLTESLESLNEKRASLEKDLARKEKALKRAKGDKRKTLNTEIQALAREISNTRRGIELTELASSHIYQVEVLRGTPLHAALLSDSFEFYQTGEGKPLMEVSDAELDAEIERRAAERCAFVSSMIPSLPLSWNGEGKKDAYAVELIGESMMQVLYNAHTAVNVKPGGLGILQRFREMGENRKWV